MTRWTVGWRRAVLAAVAAVAAAGTGCHSTGGKHAVAFGGDAIPADAVPAEEGKLPRELSMVSLPPYTVAAPDILLINAQRLIPLPPYRVEPLDVLYLFAPGAPEQVPINGLYPVDPDGTINLGPSYGGQVRVSDLTVPEIEKVLTAKLKGFLMNPALTVSLAAAGGR